MSSALPFCFPVLVMSRVLCLREGEPKQFMKKLKSCLKLNGGCFWTRTRRMGMSPFHICTMGWWQRAKTRSSRVRSLCRCSLGFSTDFPWNLTKPFGEKCVPLHQETGKSKSKSTSSMVFKPQLGSGMTILMNSKLGLSSFFSGGIFSSKKKKKKKKDKITTVSKKWNEYI